MTGDALPPVRWKIPATSAVVGPARHRALAQALSWCYRLDEVGRQMLKLLVSEMVGNALLHGLPDGDPDAHIAIGMEPVTGGIMVVVHDHSRTPPSHLMAEPMDDEHGRGVPIMQELAYSNGWFPTPDGKAVFAIMAAVRAPGRAQRRAALLDRIRAIRPRIRVHLADATVAA